MSDDKACDANVIRTYTIQLYYTSHAKQ